MSPLSGSIPIASSHARPTISWGDKVGKLSVVLLVLVVLSISGTYITITQSAEPLSSDSDLVKWLTGINLILVFSLLIIIGYRLLRLWNALKAGTVGSRLQTRIILVFGIVTILPTIMVSTFAAILLNYGIKSWFDERVNTALTESVAVAELYLDEHKENIKADATAMAADIKRELPNAIIDPVFFSNIINGQVALRALAEAVVIQNNAVIGRSHLSFSLAFERLPNELTERVKREEIVIYDNDDKITAIVLLDGYSETYLVISRFIDNRVLSHMEQTQGAVSEYNRLKTEISGLQIQFSVAFIIVSLLLLLTIVWYGIIFASRLVVPLSRLINATERVRAGDFSTRVDMLQQNDEIGLLMQRFNRMTEQLQTQRRELTYATRTIDARRRFNEAVLEGASAGVLALDASQRVTLYNRSAAKLLNLSESENLRGRAITELLPGIAELMQEAEENPLELHQKDISLTQDDGNGLTLHIRLTTQHQGEKIEGYIVTCDDITPLIQAQRRAAWSDVARRIAHEIKNPLTPIQLATERLKKRYTPKDEEDKASYLRYLEMINKHVHDIRSMVEEFVSFARSQNPVFQPESISAIIKRATFSAQTAYSGIEIAFQDSKKPMEIMGDERQISQVFTNLLKNAAEAIEEQEVKSEKGKITLILSHEAEQCIIDVKDNGPGFPEDLMQTLLDPYVTTREKGTGLGLSIVRKIIEDHHGTITLANQKQGGAWVRINLPVVQS